MGNEEVENELLEGPSMNPRRTRKKSGCCCALSPSFVGLPLTNWLLGMFSWLLLAIHKSQPTWQGRLLSLHLLSLHKHVHHFCGNSQGQGKLTTGRASVGTQVTLPVYSSYRRHPVPVPYSFLQWAAQVQTLDGPFYYCKACRQTRTWPSIIPQKIQQGL